MRRQPPKNLGLILLPVLLVAFFSLHIETSQAADPLQDTDQDGLTDEQEQTIYHTNWLLPDTDGDGHSDGEEIQSGHSPLHNTLTLKESDTDEDGLNDDWEIKLGTDLTAPDSDGDGRTDGDEVTNGFSPTSLSQDSVEKRIHVSTKDLRLAYYFGNVELDNIPVSTGKKTTPTPKGNFKILLKLPVHDYRGATWNYPNTKWNLHFTSKKYRYFIHGAYWHNKFGIRPVSGGCVNVRYSDMERLYNWAQVGTKVFVE